MAEQRKQAKTAGPDDQDPNPTIDGLLESEEHYRLLVENIPSVSWTTDSQGVTRYISPNVEKVYGYTPEEIYSGGDQIWLGRIHPGDVDRVQAAFTDLLERGVRFDVEYRSTGTSRKRISCCVRRSSRSAGTAT